MILSLLGWKADVFRTFGRSWIEDVHLGFLFAHDGRKHTLVMINE